MQLICFFKLRSFNVKLYLRCLIFGFVCVPQQFFVFPLNMAQSLFAFFIIKCIKICPSECHWRMGIAVKLLFCKDKISATVSKKIYFFPPFTFSFPFSFTSFFIKRGKIVLGLKEIKKQSKFLSPCIMYTLRIMSIGCVFLLRILKGFCQ